MSLHVLHDLLTTQALFDFPDEWAQAEQLLAKHCSQILEHHPLPEALWTRAWIPGRGQDQARLLGTPMHAAIDRHWPCVVEALRAAGAGWRGGHVSGQLPGMEWQADALPRAMHAVTNALAQAEVADGLRTRPDQLRKILNLAGHGTDDAEALWEPSWKVMRAQAQGAKDVLAVVVQGGEDPMAPDSRTKSSALELWVRWVMGGGAVEDPEHRRSDQRAVLGLLCHQAFDDQAMDTVMTCAQTHGFQETQSLVLRMGLKQALERVTGNGGQERERKRV